MLQYLYGIAKRSCGTRQEMANAQLIVINAVLGSCGSCPLPADGGNRRHSKAAHWQVQLDRQQHHRISLAGKERLGGSRHFLKRNISYLMGGQDFARIFRRTHGVDSFTGLLVAALQFGLRDRRLASRDCAIGTSCCDGWLAYSACHNESLKLSLRELDAFGGTEAGAGTAWFVCVLACLS